MHDLTLKSKAVGDLVIIENMVDVDRFFKGGIHLPKLKLENDRAIKGKVISLGEVARKEGLKEGDVVLYDMWSQFGERGKASDKPGEIVITKVENVLLICE